MVVLPTGAGLDVQVSRFTEIWLASLFAIATAVTAFNANGVPLLEWVIAPFSTEITQQDFVDAVPGTLALMFALGEPRMHACMHGRAGPGLCHRRGAASSACTMRAMLCF